MGVNERFNRYYTDKDYRPAKTIFVSRDGGGSGDARDTPITALEAFALVRPGEQITFLADAQPYEGCFELDEDTNGTYDAPIVIYAERNDDVAGIDALILYREQFVIPPVRDAGFAILEPLIPGALTDQRCEAVAETFRQ